MWNNLQKRISIFIVIILSLVILKTYDGQKGIAQGCTSESRKATLLMSVEVQESAGSPHNLRESAQQPQLWGGTRPFGWGSPR